METGIHQHVVLSGDALVGPHELAADLVAAGDDVALVLSVDGAPAWVLDLTRADHAGFADGLHALLLSGLAWAELRALRHAEQPQAGSPTRAVPSVDDSPVHGRDSVPMINSAAPPMVAA